MRNRFTKQLQQLQLIDPHTEFERFNWPDLLNINASLDRFVLDYSDSVEQSKTAFETELSERWILVCFLAAMSDEDIDELVINWKAPE